MCAFQTLIADHIEIIRALQLKLNRLQNGLAMPRNLEAEQECERAIAHHELMLRETRARARRVTS
jgi:hypothetical protein